MTKRKQKSKDGEARRKQIRQRRSAAIESGLLGTGRPPRGDRHILMALTMASLVAGILFVVNGDRSIHAQAAAKEGVGVSLHGWPMVYLERRFESLPAFLLTSKINHWPYPIEPREVRSMNYRNLMIDIGLGLAIVVVTYFSVRQVVARYEKWKLTWPD